MKFTTDNVRKLHERGFVSDEFLNNMEQMSEVLKEEKTQKEISLDVPDQDKEDYSEEMEM